LKYCTFCYKISKIGATGCQIFRLKCIKFDFHWAPPQTPLGELTALPRPLAAFKGAYFQRKGKGRRGEEGK